MPLSNSGLGRSVQATPKGISVVGWMPALATSYRARMSSSVGRRSSRLAVRSRRSNRGHSGCATGRIIRTMTTATTFRQRVLRGDALLGAFLNLGSPAAAELCARAGFDWLIVALEH